MRITSTYVENTNTIIITCSALMDHLHIRGEHLLLWISSDNFFRITSTYVENTVTHLTLVRRSKDHLHIRGEHRVYDADGLSPTGSPPHTWRTHYVWDDKKEAPRITSTYVENTDLPPICDRLPKDHLHIRGEHCFFVKSLSSAIGSPPHTWRTQICCNNQSRWLRITSTYVENT